MKLFARFVREESGEDLIEYGLLAAFVAAVAVFVLGSPNLKNGISDAFARAVSTMVNATF
jgi:Flp pilus assembly pilin Flp